MARSIAALAGTSSTSPCSAAIRRARVWACLAVLATAACPAPAVAGGPEGAPAVEPEPAAAPAPPQPGEQLRAAEDERAEKRIQDEVERRMADLRAREEARAQVRKKRARFVPHFEYLEDSYLDYFFPTQGPVGDSPLLFEAQASVHLFLLNQWDKVEQISSPGAMASVWSWDVSFLLRLRMLQERSAPVRPPSYVPATRVQWFGLWKTDGGGVRELEAELGLGHHSNGQQQCPFVPEGQQGTASPGTCLSPGQASGSLAHNVNYRSGDFFTSYGTIGIHYAQMSLDADRYLDSRASLGAVYEENFVGGHDFLGAFPGAIGADQARLYGIHRLKLEAQARWHLGDPSDGRAGVLALSLSQEFMWKTALSIPNNRTIGEISYTLDGLHGAGLFVRGYTGQDSMNILYAAGRTSMIQLGLTWTASPAVPYRFGEGEFQGDYD